MRFRSTSAVCGALALASVASAGATVPEFIPGDIWLISTAIPATGGGSQRAAVCIDPATWTTMTFPLTTGFAQGRAAFCAARQRIVYSSDTGLRTADAVGVADAVALGPVAADNPATTGDGRIYYSVGGAGILGFVDAAGVAHDLLATDGVTVASIQSVDALWYDGATNSLFGADDSVPGETRIMRLSLNAPGDQVTAVATTLYDVSESGEIAVGFSAGPAGSVFLKVDDNSNTAQERMLLIDPATLGVSVFATSEYFGVAGEVAGVYSAGLGAAVVLDSLNDQLRTYAQGTAGAGAIVLTTGVSGSGSGESAQLIVIPTDPCPSDLSGDGVTDGADLGLLLGAWGTPAGDLNGDGTTDGADLGLLLGAWGGC
ncbi:MAG: hypothetical protein ACF8QF_07775 [Phycisphaerales bacterium]